MLPPVFESCLQQTGQVADILVFDKLERRKSKACPTRLWLGGMPSGSLCPLNENVAVPSPAFTFLLMARELDLFELIAYGHELCGTYAFDDSSPRGMSQRSVQLATVGDLERCLETAGGAAGVRKARRALPFIIEGSASPMETIDSMLLCLPYRYGGYGLRPPLLNYRIEFGPQACRVAMRGSCRADMCWPDLKFAVEHQGWHDHAGSKEYSSDRSRINALKVEGYEVIEITGGISGNLAAFEEIALEIARRQGKRILAEALGATSQRIALRKTLFAWNARSGRGARQG